MYISGLKRVKFEATTLILLCNIHALHAKLVSLIRPGRCRALAMRSLKQKPYYWSSRMRSTRLSQKCINADPQDTETVHAVPLVTACPLPQDSLACARLFNASYVDA